MAKVAILGFGVVGGGVAEMITKNKRELEGFAGEGVTIKYILDLRDFPDSPFGDRVVHDFAAICSDPEVDIVIEAMGGCHPAYEYTVSALKAGKSVITSNKEVASHHLDEFLALAEENGVHYMFEASVGGGIPVISPIINCIRQNRVTEVRGILNGTTNYILTKMFSLGESFDASLADAQAKGYAEKNPDADVLGHDACRKIAILTALATGKVVPVDNIHTEGITGIRKKDVDASASIGRSIKLLGRCKVTDGGVDVCVAPYLIPRDEPLSSVSGVYNAVEVLGEPIGKVMFYGPGAGGGPTASAIVGDLAQLVRSKGSCIRPKAERDGDALLPHSESASASYIALRGGCESCVRGAFGEVSFIEAEDELAFITPVMTEGETEEALKALADRGISVVSRIRLL